MHSRIRMHRAPQIQNLQIQVSEVIAHLDNVSADLYITGHHIGYRAVAVGHPVDFLFDVFQRFRNGNDMQVTHTRIAVEIETALYPRDVDFGGFPDFLATDHTVENSLLTAKAGDFGTFRDAVSVFVVHFEFHVPPFVPTGYVQSPNRTR